MSTKMKAELEAVIQKWADDKCEQEDWPMVWWPDTLIPRIADAAHNVLMAHIESQEFAKTQEPEE